MPPTPYIHTFLYLCIMYVCIQESASSAKDRIAKSMIEEAEKRREISPAKYILTYIHTYIHTYEMRHPLVLSQEKLFWWSRLPSTLVRHCIHTYTLHSSK